MRLPDYTTPSCENTPIVEKPGFPGIDSRSPTGTSLANRPSSLQNEHSQPSRSSSPLLATTFGDIRISNSIHGRDTGTSHAGTSPSPLSARRETSSSNLHSPQIISTDKIASLIREFSQCSLVLDIRSLGQHNRARLKDSINIPIPAILLKREAKTIPKIAESLPSESERSRFMEWKHKKLIVLYDEDSYNVGPGTAMYQSASKFLQEGNHVVVIQGGFKAIHRDASALVEEPRTSDKGTPTKSETHNNGIELPKTASCAVQNAQAANPFFDNIRQNTDLIGGVGQPIAMIKPDIAAHVRDRLPAWLAELAFEANGPQRIADKFLKIERDEQRRMQAVLMDHKSSENDAQRHSIAAGLERGDKNRYNNIWPFENARVKLSETSKCDYINASHLQAENSRMQYIATQGPLPSTEVDFWQAVWENDIEVIIMLTRTFEGGQAKCHQYWDRQRDIGPFILKQVDEFEQVDRYRGSKPVSVIIRKFKLSHRDRNLTEPREITQIHYSDWPDLHVIEPEAILVILRIKLQQENGPDTPMVKRRKSVGSAQAASKAKPVLVHCSAGCGRTGVICTVDTVLSLLQAQQRDKGSDQSDVDLVEKTVQEFRDQRISMVQTLRQYVLCYDAVLIYCIEQIEKSLQ